MKKPAGTILTAVGAIGTIVTGIQAARNSESFSFLGVDVAVSSADWTPMFISIAVLLLGLFLLMRK